MYYQEWDSNDNKFSQNFNRHMARFSRIRFLGKAAGHYWLWKDQWEEKNEK